MKINLNFLSHQIKLARVESTLSQEALADQLGVSNKTISAYESSRAIPPIHTLSKIAKVTNKPLYFFVNEMKENTYEILNAKIDRILKELEEIKNKI